MKRCPTCNRTYTDPSLNFCLEDGSPLAADLDPNATIRYPGGRDTAEPPPTEIYRPQPQVVTPRPTTTPPPPPPPQQWTPPPPSAPPPKKSNAVWWVLGGLAALFIIGIGIVVMIIALASMSSNTNTSNLNTNTRNENRIANVNANSNVANTNANANANATVPNSLVDDFSQQKWGTGVSQYGRIWYADGEYHMSSREKTFVVMYAPSDEYNTENATVKITARSVDGGVPSAGFGLMVHCAQSKAKQLEDYALLIYPSDEPEYEVIKHKDGVQSSVVTKTKSSALRSGSAPNLLEVRIRGTELSFYANGQFLTKINDTENYRKGRAGLYTSDVHEVAFDDLSINR
ncbi:MAG TPA: hypothetical protein VN659_01190 [Pyrinomonadaceae bacterium]|nr:hypothetical protein [Pyrinomonadaceae bacterium]